MIGNHKVIKILAAGGVLTGSVVLAMTTISRLVQPELSNAQVQPASQRPTVAVGEANAEIDPETGFALAAFPPTITDNEWHHDAWTETNCLDCHETGVGDAPLIRHYGITPLAMESICRTCHVVEPGKVAGVTVEYHGFFLESAFPPMLPNNDNHVNVWNSSECLTCHVRGIGDAAKIVHKGMPELLLEAVCRTCHVQVRSHESIPGPY